MSISVVAESLIGEIIKELQRMYPEDPIYPMRDYSTIVYSARHCMRKGGSRVEKIAWLTACLIYYTITGHPLIDGNKRLAVSIAGISLLKNKYNVKDDVLYDLAIAIACGRITLEKTFRVIYENVKQIEELEATRPDIYEYMENKRKLLDKLREYDKESTHKQ